MKFTTNFFSHLPEGVYLAIKVAPQSSRNQIEGVVMDAMGSHALKVRITAVPEDGKANKMMLTYLAKTLKIPASSIAIIAGETARHKTLFIAEPPEDLVKKIARLQSS
jgi:uncharacterized protein (TIGR00251 family)